MAAIKLFCDLIQVDFYKLTLKEKMLFEVNLFASICDELMKIFHDRKKYNHLKNNGNKEASMLECNVVKFIIEDLLFSEDYSIEGIAYYTQFPEDVICDVISGKNKMPSLELSRKVIELHRISRPDLYKQIIKNVGQDYLSNMA
jgi:hypothetical protein